ncbi:hypothetical protein [Cytobacillus kochii]|uniref:hypothetical protein n=1 Tax=Cytobacillus kochii TaxID=859143 RepID=UPI0024806933|nr:hypothetical protein [Cytobacillus kochii]
MYSYKLELPQLLAKTYIKYGLNTDEFIVLNATITLVPYGQKPNIEEIGQTTGKKGSEVKEILISLFEKGKIQLDRNGLDLSFLYHKLDEVVRSEMTIVDRLVESKEYHSMMGSHGRHMGEVELLPYKNDGEVQSVAVSVQSDVGSKGEIWSRKSMIEWANYILKFTEHVDDEWINQYNTDIKEQRMKQNEIDKIHLEQLEKEREIRDLPKKGYILLIKFPNGSYKFTYTTSLLLDQKISNTKQQYGDNIQIVHTLETHDTMKFFYKFLRSQFSNRFNGEVYELTDEDVQYIRAEKFPSNAMEWFEGHSPVEK